MKTAIIASMLVLALLVGGVTGGSQIFYSLSKHTLPRAGILIEYVQTSSSYRTFLLVSPFTS